MRPGLLPDDGGQLCGRGARRLLVIAFEGIARHGLRQSHAYQARLESVFALLLANPRMGRARPEIGGDVRSLVIGSHLAFYRAVETGIEILRIRHQHEDWLDETGSA